jgi:hypothetical protein
MSKDMARVKHMHLDVWLCNRTSLGYYECLGDCCSNKAPNEREWKKEREREGVVLS